MKDKIETLNYIIDENLTLFCLDSGISNECIVPLFYIKSNFVKNSSGKGLLSYYNNCFYNENHEQIKNCMLEFNNIKCQIFGNDIWGKYDSNNYGIILKCIITDKTGVTKEINFRQDYKPNSRFVDLFEYLALLDKGCTHKACKLFKSKIYKLNTIKSN